MSRWIPRKLRLLKLQIPRENSMSMHNYSRLRPLD
jgi:hypothetical protein